MCSEELATVRSSQSAAAVSTALAPTSARAAVNCTPPPKGARTPAVQSPPGPRHPPPVPGSPPASSGSPSTCHRGKPAGSRAGAQRCDSRPRAHTAGPGHHVERRAVRPPVAAGAESPEARGHPRSGWGGCQRPSPYLLPGGRAEAAAGLLHGSRPSVPPPAAVCPRRPARHGTAGRRHGPARPPRGSGGGALAGPPPRRVSRPGARRSAGLGRLQGSGGGGGLVPASGRPGGRRERASLRFSAGLPPLPPIMIPKSPLDPCAELPLSSLCQRKQL